MRPPNAMNSDEEYLQVYNFDIPDMCSPCQLERQALIASQIAAHDPGAFVWRGMVHISAQEWADERIVACRKRMAELVDPTAMLPEGPGVGQERGEIANGMQPGPGRGHKGVLSPDTFPPATLTDLGIPRQRRKAMVKPWI